MVPSQGQEHAHLACGHWSLSDLKVPLVERRCFLAGAGRGRCQAPGREQGLPLTQLAIELSLLAGALPEVAGLADEGDRGQEGDRRDGGSARGAGVSIQPLQLEWGPFGKTG